jgi:hypothetical protein
MAATNTRPLAAITGPSSGIEFDVASSSSARTYSTRRSAPTRKTTQRRRARRIRGADGRQGAPFSRSTRTMFQARASRLMPDSAKAEAHRIMAEPGSGTDN